MANLGLQNNNPGNLRDPITGNFRVFSTPEEGHQALLSDIKLKQSGQSKHIQPGASIEQFANVWAPASDNNDPKNYANTLARFLGVNTAYAFDEIPPDKLAEGIKIAEGTTALPSSGGKLSPQEFAKKIKEKYPAYQNVDDNVLVEKMLAKYPAYADKVDMSMSTSQQSVKTPQSDEGIGKKILRGVSYLGGGPGFGEDVIGSFDATRAANLFDEATKGTISLASNVIAKMKENETQGRDNTRLKNALQMLIQDSPKLEEFMPDVVNKTTTQILADFGQVALAAGATAIPGAGSVAGRILEAGAVGGAMSGTGAIQEGSTDLGEIGTEAAKGLAIGLATGGLIEGAAAGFKGAKNFFRGGRTPEDVMAMPESELSKLSPKERQYRFSEETKARNEEFRQKNNKIKQDLDVAAKESQEALKKLSEDLRVKAADADTVPVRIKIKEHMGDANKKYGKQLEEALAPVEDMPVSNQDLNDFLNTKYAENPEEAKVVKDLFGINEADFVTAKNGVSSPQDTTIGELFERVRDLKSEIGKAGKSGSRALTAEEYVKSKATDDLMNFIHQKAEGTPFSEIIKKANEDWKVWAALRSRIFKELKPFGVEVGQEIPFKKTIVNVAKGKATTDTKHFIKQLEEMIGEPIGKETQAAFAKLDAEKQAMVLQKAEADIAKETTRLEKLAEEKDWRMSKFKTEQKAAKREILKNILLGATKWVGIGTLGGVGVKTLLH